MARTVAEIDGDSSGLVSELGKAKKSMGDLGTEGKKLTTQLKDVADQADIAAGNLVNKIGGPNAIKAIGGVGLAFEGASRLVGAFMDSSEALFRSYGEEGQKAWDATEKSLQAVKGAFAEAVLGGGDLEDMAGRLQSILGGVKTALDLLLTPLATISKLFVGIGKNLQDVSGYVVEASDKLDKLAGDARAASLKTTADGIEAMRIRIMQLRGDTQGLFEIEMKRDLAKAESMKADIRAAELQADALATGAVLANAQPELQKKASAAQQAYIRDLGEEKLSQAQLAEARRIYNQTLLLEGQKLAAEEMERRKGMSEANAAQLAEIDAQIASLKELEKQGAKTNTPRTTGGGAAKPDVGAAEQSLQQRIAAAMEAAKRESDAALALKQQNDKTEQDMQLDALKRELDIIEQKKKAAAEFVEFSQKLEQDHIDEMHARGELTEEERQAQLDARIDAVKASLAEETSAYLKNAGKQLAIGEMSAEEAADVAREQLGNVIMGLGDKAMAEAGIMAAGLNPLAIPMAAAGMAAYAIGNAIGASEKQVATTPATTAAEQQAVPANYSFNLQVDSVFADGESVARQFARMQESARQRGLLSQGAY